MEYLSHKELATRLKHSEGYLHLRRDTHMVEGTHYIRPFGSRKYLYNWTRVEELLLDYHKR